VKVLIWQTAYLGDVILTTPLIRTVREELSASKITFVGRPFIEELFSGWDIELIPFNKGFLESFKIVRKIKDHDVAVVPHRSLRTALIIMTSRIPVRVGFDRSEFPSAFTHRVEHRWNMHEVDRNLELLKPLGVSKFIRDTYLPLSDEEKDKTLTGFGLKDEEYIVINPFSNFPLKEPDPGLWLDLIDLLYPLRVVITGVARDRERSKEFEKKKGVLNLTGKTSLRELMAVISGAKLLISCDSSPVHIAGALGTPAVTLYTSTSPDYGFYPLRGSYIVNPAPCSPCSPNPKRCPRGTLECRYSLRSQAVFQSIKKFL